MFIRRCYRQKDGKRHAYWAVVESYRSERGPRQRVVAWLGDVQESERFGVQQQHGEKTPMDRRSCSRGERRKLNGSRSI
jgi:hypothetical protein